MYVDLSRSASAFIAFLRGDRIGSLAIAFHQELAEHTSKRRLRCERHNILVSIGFGTSGTALSVQTRSVVQRNTPLLRPVSNVTSSIGCRSDTDVYLTYAVVNRPAPLGPCFARL